MKQMNKTKKIKTSVVLKTIVVLIALFAMLLNSILGVTKAEYFKKLSKVLDFEAGPDLALQYYLYDANTEEGRSSPHQYSDYHEKTGVYKDAKNILQPIAVGTKDVHTISSNDYFFGDSIVYQIKIPVDEEGYYTLDFTVDFLFGGTQDPYQSDLNKYGYNSQGFHETENEAYHYKHPDNEYFDDSVFSQHYQYCMGCEVLNADDNFVFGTDFNMENRVSTTNAQTKYHDEKIYYADNGTHSVYQWKTLTPTRAETVKLSFKATDADVTKGYVIWAWDLTGIKGQHNYRISITGLDVNKVMNLDGTTDYRSNVDPYFMFPQTSFTNNQIYLNENQHSANHPNEPYYRGSNTPGKTSYSDGRGTFITEATENSLGLRAESLYHSVYKGKDVDAIMTPRSQENNPVSLQIPVKNIKYDTTYKVTFDISLARQGNTDVGNSILNNAGFDTLFKETTGANNKVNTSYGKNLYDYAAFEEIFPSTTVDTQFRSYLYSSSNLDAGIGISNEDHKVNRNQIVYANKDWSNQKLTNGQEGDFSLTKYNYVTRYNMAQSTGFNEFPKYTTLDEDGTVNDPFCTVVKDTTVTGSNNETLNMNATTCRNWYNAIQHVEQNSQQGINWITFYNTTFSFNIDKESNKENLGEANANGFINNLYWIWQIDALEYSGWYNIRIDNVRIQEVVQYSSEIEKNGVKIADTQIGMSHMKYYGKDTNVSSDNVFANYRGWNGTGQNCDARGYDTKNYFAVGNIYAPIIDARKFSVAPGTANDYKIYLDGWAVCKGGINKYVYSADGGKTWHDMTFTGTNVMADRNIKDKDGNIIEVVDGWFYAEGGVEQRLNQQTVGYGGDTNYVTFGESDGANCNFDGYALCADLEPYKNQPDLDIIIAAVPEENTNLRCEILRIINYHSSNHYVSQVEAISSDIQSSNGKIEISVDKLAITSGTSGDAAEGIGWVVVNKDEGTFRYREGNWPADYYPTSYRGVMANIQTISEPIRYDNVATMASDIPIKTTLKVKGYMLCGYGVQGYAYSVDGGKGWIDIKDAKATTYASNDYGAGKTNKYEKLLYQWITHSDYVDGNYFAYNEHKGKFDTDDTALEIDLSAYEGQVVDVIVAAKPYATSGEEGKKSDIYLPITKIDNVAVYGKTGTFYTRINSLTFDGITIQPDYFDLEGNPLNRVTKSTNGSVVPQWNLGYTADNAEEFSYTIFEPNNVNVFNSRLYNNDINEVQMGSQVVIKGYTVINGATHNNEYMFTLDGGDTWSNIDLKANVAPTDDIKNYSKLSDTSFANFNYANYYDDSTGNLTFEIPVIPDLPEGAIRTLTVVAKNAEGNTVPVLNIKLKISNVPWGTYDIKYSTSSNFAVEHQAFSYVPTNGGAATTNYPDSKLSLPSMYFEYGQPIEVSYKVPSNNTKYRVVVTKETRNNGKIMANGKYPDGAVIDGKIINATVCIKSTDLNSTEGTVNLNQVKAHDSPFLQEDNIYSGNLPVGTYKVWLVEADADMIGWISATTGVHGKEFAQDPYKYIAPKMVTEPITINVVNPENPNFGIMSNVYSPNNGKKQVEDVEIHDNARIGIDKTVFLQGEPIYFHIQLDYSFRHIMLMKADKSITDAANEPTKGSYNQDMYGKTWRYAVDGYTNGNDFLDTTGLEPGHYKLYYLMGKNLQAAIRGDRFYHDGDPSFKDDKYATYSKLLTVIDIIILPKDATQTLTVTYTKYDGTTATVTESFPMSGKALGTELHNGKLLTKYHSGIDFEQTITGTQPGTTFEFTVTTNFNAESDDIKKYFEDRFTCKVLQESVTVVSQRKLCVSFKLLE